MNFEMLGKLILEELKMIRKDMKTEVRKLGEEIKCRHCADKALSNFSKEYCKDLPGPENLSSEEEGSVQVNNLQHKEKVLLASTEKNVSKTNFSIIDRLAKSKNKRKLYNNHRDRNQVYGKVPHNIPVKVENPMSYMSYEAGIDMSECFTEVSNSADGEINLDPEFIKGPPDESLDLSNLQFVGNSLSSAGIQTDEDSVSDSDMFYNTSTDTDYKNSAESNEVLNFSEAKKVCMSSDLTTATNLSSELHPCNLSEENFKCHFCGKPFRHFSSYQSHLRSHTGEKPFPCPVCHKMFGQKGNLKAHMVTHADEKPHVCSICDKRFSQKGNLKSHLLLHQREQIFSCDKCKKCFKSLIHLTAHSSVHS